jgi:hypothetical protein
LSIAQTILREEIHDVDRRLADLGLDRRKLLSVRLRAVSAAADANPNFPANSAGTFSYHYGTAGLREEFADAGFVMERPDGVEVISNVDRKIRVVFANVDIAGARDYQPKPRSHKGSGSERVCMENGLFGDLPRFALSPMPGWAVFYLMVDERGAAELSRPVVEHGTFSAYVERIILSDGSDLDDEVTLDSDEDVADDFDPKVVRK